MRRISLALALVGAVTAAGCSGGAKSSSTGTNPGVADGTFKVTVQNGQDGNTGLAIKGGYVTSTPAGINCGAGVATQVCSYSFATGTAVTLNSYPATGNLLLGWAGDCFGAGACVLTGNADKYIVVQFGTEADRTGHANLTDPVLHVSAYLERNNNDGMQCSSCHGAGLQGSGIAVACGSCHAQGGHDWPVTAAGVTTNVAVVASVGKHFQAAGHNSGSCARCHAGDGFRDFIGADGSASNVISVQYGSSAPAATDVTTACTADLIAAGTPCLNSGMKCDMCHNTATALGGGTLNQHVFPSGTTVTLDGTSAICSQCHDGGRAGYNVFQVKSVLDTNALAGVTGDAQLTSSNAAVRAHYLPAASTLFGATVGGWSEYTGNIYTAQNQHGGIASCTTCHDAHTGQLPADRDIGAKCGSCHFDATTGLAVSTFLQLQDSRQFGFEGDIDGDGVEESLKLEIDGLGAKLFTAITTYATTIAGAPICTLDNKWYIVADAAVACGTAPNATAYNKFTPRLLKAAFNYQMYQNDVGAWAHNPRYAIEVIYDSIADLNVGLGASFVPNGNRAFNSHFGAAEDPSPYAAMIYHGGSNALTGEVLPTMGFTSAACYQCHGGAGGLAAYVATAPAALASTAVSNKVTALECSTCHAYDGADMKGIRNDVGTVYFPPQKGNPPLATQNVVSFASTDLPNSFAVCGTCHSGRENGATIDIAIGTTADTSFTLGFKNPHYLGAAGMILGNDAKVLYQYPGQTYAGKTVFWKTGTNGNAPGPHGSPHGAECTGCHQPKASKHSFEVDLTYCATCHKATTYGDYSLAPVEEEYKVATAELLTSIQTYAAANASASGVEGICYNAAKNPYFFKVVGGICQDGVANAPAASASFTTFNPKLLKAAYNYQWTQKEPGAWAHNEVYVMEAIYDSIVDLGGTPSFTRP
jgi:hypothetical protein